nr:hypothetical protein [Tanacetum cinerariifolium]
MYLDTYHRLGGVGDGIDGSSSAVGTSSTTPSPTSCATSILSKSGVSTPKNPLPTLFGSRQGKCTLCSIKYALTVNPNIYVSCIKQFWTIVVVKKVNYVIRLQALVDKKKVVVSKATIREALHMDDAEGVECLLNEEIFAELAIMGYEKLSTKLTFYKVFFSSQVSKGFSGVETPLFESMLVAQEVGEGVVDEVPTADEEPSISSPTPPNLCHSRESRKEKKYRLRDQYWQILKVVLIQEQRQGLIWQFIQSSTTRAIYAKLVKLLYTRTRDVITTANARYWKIPACCDDDEDYDSAITPNEFVDSLNKRDEHLNTILATKSDEFIKSSVENLVLNPKFVSENSNAEIESFSPSPFPIKDSDSFMEEIDLSFTPDGPMPPGIEDDNYDSERDILICEELLDNYSLSLYVIESYHFDIPSFSLPPAKPPDEKQLEEEQAAKAQNWKLPVCYDDDDDEESSKSLEDDIISELPPYLAVTPSEPVDSLNMGNEHLNTILATESDEFIKSCVENLVPNPSEFEGKNECDVPAGFTTFSNVLFDADYDFDSGDDQSFSDEDFLKKIYLNPFFDEKINPMKIDQHSFNAESDLIESMPNNDSSIIISLKIDSLFDEFAGGLTLLKSIPPGIDETDCHPEKETRFAKRLLYDNSSPRPPEEIVFDNSNADIESFSPSPISNKDSGSHMEEIDLPFTPDDPMPPSIEDDDYDSRRDILILEELLDNYSLSLPANESYHFDIPSPYRPPAKPPDGKTRTLNIKMMGDVSDKKVHIPGLMITRILNQEKSPGLLSHLGLEAFQPSAECPMIINGKNIPLLDVPLFHFYPP